MAETEDFAQVEITSARQLRSWLEGNHAQRDSIWIVTYKKHRGDRYVSTSEILDELIAFGWVDGVRRKLDEDRTTQLISPRRAHHWAASYKKRAAALEREGRMHAAGRRAIEESKRRGLWDFMDDVDALEKPEDLVEALAAHPGAAENFDAFGAATQRFALRWIKLAKRPETRARRVAETARRAGRNEKVPGS